MKAEAYITINWNGPYSRGEAAVAIVLKAENDPNNYLKLFGFSHLSHQHAEALAALRTISIVKPGTDLTITVEYPYAAMMMKKENHNINAHKELWTEFYEKADHINLTVIRDMNHRFKLSSIRATEKGGYRMEEMEDTYGRTKEERSENKGQAIP